MFLDGTFLCFVVVSSMVYEMTAERSYQEHFISMPKIEVTKVCISAESNFVRL